MSLHIEITEEAQAEFEKMQKKSLFSSIIVSVLSFTLLAILFITLKIIIADPPTQAVVAYTPAYSPSPSPTSDDLNAPTESSSAPSPSRILTTTSTSSISVPAVDVPTDAAPTISTSIEIGVGIGGTVGSGIGGGLPSVMAKRCSLEDRLQRIKQSGGSEKFEDSVVKGLRWLMKNQNKDGSWGSTNKSAMTGLALLCYLAHCETPYSEEFGESCQNGIVYLIGLGKKNNNMLSDTPTVKFLSYQHAICTYALAEAYTFCDSIQLPIEGLKETVEKAAEIIIKSQANDGSWMYYYKTKPEGGAYPDLSVSGWNIQALKAVKHSPAKGVDTDRAMRRAETFVKKMGDTRTGKFKYRESEAPRDSMGPVGVLSLQMMSQGHAKEAREGIKDMEKTIKPVFEDPYTYYYAAQAFINRGGPAWENFGKKMGEVIVSKQNADGSWPKTPKIMLYNVPNAPEQALYGNCLNILTLEVYYRFLPATGEGTKNNTSLRDQD